MPIGSLATLLVSVASVIIAAVKLPGWKAKFGVSCGILTLAVVLIFAFTGGIYSERPAGAGTPMPTPAPTVVVTFNEYDATTTFGTNVYITGNDADLGNWNTATAQELSPATYPVWRITLTLPANTTIDYKYIEKDSSGIGTWEPIGGNHQITTGSTGHIIINNTWGKVE